MDAQPHNPWDRPVAWAGDGAAAPATSLPVDVPATEAPASALPPKRVVVAGPPIAPAESEPGDPWTVHAPAAWAPSSAGDHAAPSTSPTPEQPSGSPPWPSAPPAASTAAAGAWTPAGPAPTSQPDPWAAEAAAPFETTPTSAPLAAPGDTWTPGTDDPWAPTPPEAPRSAPTSTPPDAWTPGTDDPWAPTPAAQADPAPASAALTAANAPAPGAPDGSLASSPPPLPPPPPHLATPGPAIDPVTDLVAVDEADPGTGWDRADLLPTALTVPILPDHLQDLKAKAQEALIERMGSRLYDRSLTEEQIENYVVTELGGFLFEEDVRLADHEREQLTAELLNDVLRHGPIEPFLDDETVSEIMVNGLASIYVERSGKLERTQSNFLTEAHLRQIIERIVSKVGRRIDESSPMVDARLPDGSRVNAVIPPLAVDGPSLTIRKFSQDALTVNDLVHFGTLSPISVEFLTCAVRGRLNLLVSGGTGTGKTTMLNVLSSFIPEEERIVTLEDAVELQLKQQHLVRLESRPANVEGKGQVSIRDLVRNSLRMRPDRVIIGECRGGEAMDMLQAMNTGHDGSLSTLHANGPRDAIARLETLCLMAGMDLPVKAIREQIASAVDLIVHVARLRDGTRRVTHISEVVGLDGDSLAMTDIFTFDFDAGIDSDGRYAGLLCPTGQVPVVLTKLREHGEDVAPELFQRDDDFAESGY